MILEPIVQSDIKKLGELQLAGWRDITPKFEFYLKMPFCLPMKVMLANKIVGIVSGILFIKTGWLAHIIVKPDYRGRGIGTFIINQLLNRLKKMGCNTISLTATDLGYPLYIKAGFIEQTEYIVFERKTVKKDQACSKNITNFTESKKAANICFG